MLMVKLDYTSPESIDAYLQFIDHDADGGKDTQKYLLPHLTFECLLARQAKGVHTV